MILLNRLKNFAITGNTLSSSSAAAPCCINIYINILQAHHDGRLVNHIQFTVNFFDSKELIRSSLIKV